MKNLQTFKEFLNESNIQEAYNELLESEVNYKSDKFALVFVGGSIGQRAATPIFVKGQMGSVSETGNDKEALKEKADRLRKQLSAGERKYYGMNYTVIELTPSKVKEIEYLISKQQSSANEEN